MCSRFLAVRCRHLLVALLVALSACGPPDSGSLDQATITLVIPYHPGGGFDRAARAFAPFLASELGPDANVLPENVPGAGGRRGATKVFKARPDGTTLGVFNLPGFVLPEILGEKVDYDLRNMSWIGQLESQPYALLVPGTSELRSIADIRQLEQITFLSTGYGASVLAATQIAAESFRLADEDPIFLSGYAGTADYLVGLIRGDGHVGIAPVSTAAPYIDSGDLRPLAVSGAISTLEGVPTFAELGYPELADLGVRRSIAGPPGIDSQLLGQLRDAFMRAATNPEFQAMAANMRLELSPLDGDEAAAAVAASFTFYEAFRTNLRNPNAL